MDWDWGEGSYETTARQLEPAAARAVEVAGIQAGERVVDVGCGTGNAALLAARRGATVTAVDPSQRLLDAARERAAAEGASVTLAVGEGARIPADDGSFDVAVAVFSVIFAPDADRCVAELLRVVRPGGRVVVTSWQPAGAIFEASELLREGEPPRSSPWINERGIQGLFAPYGVTPSVEQATLPFVADSADAWFADVEANHPAWRAVRASWAPEKWSAMRVRSLDILRRHNEDPAGFRVTSPYLITRAERGAA